MTEADFYYVLSRIKVVMTRSTLKFNVVLA